MVAFASETFDTTVFDAGDIEVAGFDASAFGATLVQGDQQLLTNGADTQGFGTAHAAAAIFSTGSEHSTLGDARAGAAIFAVGAATQSLGTAKTQITVTGVGHAAAAYGTAKLPGVISPAGNIPTHIAYGTPGLGFRIKFQPGLNANEFGVSNVQKCLELSGFDATSFGDPRSALLQLYATSTNDGAFGTPSVAGRIGVDPPTQQIGPNNSFGLAAVGDFDGTPDYLYPPYFDGLSITITHKVAAKIGPTGFDALTVGNIPEYRTWSFGGNEHSAFGTAYAGFTPVDFVERDGRFPAYNSLLYPFGNLQGKVYTFGLPTASYGTNKLAHVAYPESISTEAFGAPHADFTVGEWVLDSRRFASAHNSISFYLGFNPSLDIYPDSIAPISVPSPSAFPVVNVTPVEDSEAIPAPNVKRVVAPLLRIRDTKNATIKNDGVLFQWGFPKKDILAVGIRPGQVGFGLRLPRTISPTGFNAQKFWHWYWPLVTPNPYPVSWPYQGYTSPMTTRWGAAGVSNTDHIGLYPPSMKGTVPSSLSVYNVKLLAAPPGAGHAEYGTPSVANVQQTIHPLGWGPYLESFNRVWHKEPQVFNIQTGISQPGMPAIQCVLNDPDFQCIEGFRATRVGTHKVDLIYRYRPDGIAATKWGTAQVTHYTRYLEDWNPWKQTRFGEIKNLNHRMLINSVFGEVFGDMHQWKEGQIQQRPMPTESIGTAHLKWPFYAEGNEGASYGTARAAALITGSGFTGTVGGITALIDATDCGCHVCNQLPRNMVPKEFAPTQFGDFESNV